MMNCGRARDLMSGIVDNQIGLADGSNGDFEDHLRTCANCAIELSNQRKIKDLVSKLKFADPPNELALRVYTVLSMKSSQVPSLLRFATAAAAVFVFIAVLFLVTEKTAQAAPPPDNVISGAVFFDRIVQKDFVIIETNDPRKVCPCLRKMQLQSPVETKGFMCKCIHSFDTGEYACIVYSKQNELIGVFPCEQLKGLEGEYNIYKVGRNNVLVKHGKHGSSMVISRLGQNELKSLVGLR